jgi:hypothetical protein
MKWPITKSVIFTSAAAWLMWSAVHNSLGWADFILLGAVLLDFSLDPILTELEKRRRGRYFLALVRNSPLYKNRHRNGS